MRNGCRAPTRARRLQPRRARATQGVPLAVRGAVLRRDRHRCRVPGCTHARYVDVHHVETRADGGDHDAENLVTLCGAHHRAIHGGSLVITLSDDHDLTFRHVDGTPYGASPDAASLLVQTRAFQALRSLGFTEGEVRRALADARQTMTAEAPIEDVVRYCLERLTARACQRAS